MGVRTNAGGQSLALVALIAILCPAAALAQEGGRDAKPDLDLPEIVIEGIDESLLGVGETPVLLEPRTTAIPLPPPEIGPPVAVGLIDRTTRADYAPVDVPFLPQTLSVQTLLRGGTYETMEMLIDAKHGYRSGGVFGTLSGTGGDGHLRNANWNRTRANAGFALDVRSNVAWRGEVSARARNQNLPPSGLLGAFSATDGGEQTFRRLAAETRLSMETDRATIGGSVGATGVTFEEGSDTPEADLYEYGGALNVNVPLSGELWGIRASGELGGQHEEDESVSRFRRRQRLEIVGHVARSSGWGLTAGFAAHRFGSDDIAGPILRLTHQAPPDRRVWVGIAPYFEEPHLLRFLEDTRFAALRIGQASERAAVNVEGGIELEPSRSVSLRSAAGLRRSRGFAHMDRDRDDTGLYALTTLGQRYVFDWSSDVTWRVFSSVSLEPSYRLRWIEGSAVPYVPRHTARIDATFRGPVTLRAGARYLGERAPGSGEETTTLGDTWILSAGLDVEVGRRWLVSAEGDNLTDLEYRETAEYEAPGRTVQLGIQYAF